MTNPSRAARLAKLKGPDLLHAIDLEMQLGYKSLAIYSVVAFILICMFVYCIINIVRIVQFYYSQRRALNDATAAIKKNSNNPQNRMDDNEVYINRAEAAMEAENTDEYLQYTESINKSISEFKTYNEKLKAYYKENKPGEVPKDMIDKTIFANESDNY